MHRLLRVIACAMLLTACSDSDPAEPRTLQITGSYTLLTINNQPLPFTLFAFGDAFIVEQISGSMRMNANRTFHEEDVVRERFNDENGMPVLQDTIIVFTGTWENQDSVLTLQANDATVLFGFVSGNRLTLSFESGGSLFTYVYRRN